MRLFANKGKYVLDDASPKNIFYGIREDIESLSLASYLSELTQTLAPVGDEAGDFLRLFLNTLHMIETKKRPLAFLKAVYELRCIAMAAICPICSAACSAVLLKKTACIFPLRRQGFGAKTVMRNSLCPKRWALSSGVLGAMRYILYSQMEKLFSFAISAGKLKKAFVYLRKICAVYAGQNL